MNEKEQRALAIENEMESELFTECVRKDIRKGLGLSPEDEIAILRKSVALIFDIIATLHPETIDNAEFEEYHQKIEEIKQKHKQNTEATT